MQRIHTRAYSLDETTGRWVKHGVVIENGFWALNQPVRMNDGNWIMPGISAGAYSSKTTNPAAVAISHGDDFTKWDFIGIPAPEGIAMWGESGIIVDGANVLNIARYGAKAQRPGRPQHGPRPHLDHDGERAISPWRNRSPARAC